MNASQQPGAAERITFPDQRTILGDGTVYTPLLAEGRPGLQCTRPGSPSQCIYFSPSDHTDGDVPNVLVYQGTEGDPCADTPIHHHCIWPELGPIADDAPSPPLSRRADTTACRPALTAGPAANRAELISARRPSTSAG